MRSLYEYLRDANPSGIPQNDAIQLFLWIFCTTEFLPPDIRTQELSKAVLIDAFRRLSAGGLITQAGSQQETTAGLPCWDDLAREFLLGNLALDDTFPNRVGTYLPASS